MFGPFSSSVILSRQYVPHLEVIVIKTKADWRTSARRTSLLALRQKKKWWRKYISKWRGILSPYLTPRTRLSTTNTRRSKQSETIILIFHFTTQAFLKHLSQLANERTGEQISAISLYNQYIWERRQEFLGNNRISEGCWWHEGRRAHFGWWVCQAEP